MKKQLVIWLALVVWSLGAIRTWGQPAVMLDATPHAVAAPSAHSAIATEGMVATVNPIATNVGVRVLRAGGNAIDAAVAAALMLGVVDSHNSGLGGGCFILIRRADGQLVAIDGREMAPAAATRDMFIRDGKAVGSLSREGPLAAGVPGACAAYHLAIRELGTLPISNMLTWAAERAEAGFSLSEVNARSIRTVYEDGLDRFPGLRQILCKPDDQPYQEGEVLYQPDLARSYRQLARFGADWFYCGEYAKVVADWMSRHGGLITCGDFADYRAKTRTPIQTTYRDFTIVGFPPPSSGGVHVAQILNILEQFDLPGIHAEDPGAATHLVLEAMKLAFADRAHWLGDADFAAVPRGLISKAYAATLVQQIKIDQAIDVPSHGIPENWQADLFGKHTTHIAAADASGNWVAITATVNTTFGSKVVVPGTGIVLNNQMDDFSAQPGVPNAFDLVGAENNAVQPGKRPLSSMSPTIVLKDGEPVMTVGAAGGPRIITQVLLAIIRHLDFQMPLDEALARPRYHHQWRPSYVRCETSLPESIQQRLRDFGHEVKAGGSGGVSQAIGRTPDGNFIGVHDPRVPGRAAGP